MCFRCPSSVLNFLREEDGPAPVEYAVMMAFIIVVCLVAVKALGSNANKQFTAISNSLAGTGS